MTETPYSEVTATLEMLSHLGVGPHHFRWLRQIRDQATAVARAFRGGYSDTLSQHEARMSLGGRFWGVSEWAACFGVKFTPAQFVQITRFPWGPEVLQDHWQYSSSRGDTVGASHFAFLGLDTFLGKPLTIQRWIDLLADRGAQPRFSRSGWNEDYWYTREEHPFATQATCQFRWYLMPVENPTVYDTTPPAGYEVPTAIEEVTKLLLYYKLRERYASRLQAARVAELVEGQCRCLSVGRFDEAGLLISRSDLPPPPQHRDLWALARQRPTV